MSKIIAALTSDWHLQHHAWARHPELWGDSYFGLRQIVEYCLAHRVPLLAAGDLLDTKQPGPVTIGVLLEQMDRMRNAELPVYFVQGQHEYQEHPWLGIHDWPIHIHRKTIEFCSMPWYGLDWTPGDRVLEELEQIGIISYI